MNGKRNRFLSLRRGDENRPYPHGFASTRLNGTSPFPAPSLRELSSECETEGVYFDERNRSKISEPIRSGSQTISPNQPTNDTPSASLRSAAPSKREPGMGRTIQYIAQKPQHYGRFSSPLRNSKVFTFHHSTDDTPSVSHSLDSSLREGAGMGCVPFNVPLGNRKVAGDFRRPYEKFPFTRQAEA